MAKIILSFTAVFFLFFCASAQIIISLHEPPAGIVQKSQLWNLGLIYSGNNSLSITISMSVFDVNDNQPVMTAISQSFLLTGGVRQIKSSDLEPIEYSYLSPSFNVSRQPNAFLPVGNFRVCYTIYGGPKNSEDAMLSENCMNVEVNPLSPPQLNLPSDSSSVESPYPQFYWLPPSPSLLYNDLNYDLLVTEVQEGQSAYEAIQENLPVYSAFHLTAPVNNYSASYKSLDTGHVYAWRVIAKNAEAFSCQSEVWTFTLAKKQSRVSKSSPISYLELKNDDAIINTAIVQQHSLGVKFYSYEKAHEAVISFLDRKGQSVKKVTHTVQYGNNLIEFELDKSFVENEEYTVDVPVVQQKSFRGSFKIVK